MFTIKLFLAITPIIIIGVMLYKIDKDKEPPKLLRNIFLVSIGVGLLGGLLSSSLDTYLNTLNFNSLFVYNVVRLLFVIALIEEICKFIPAKLIGMKSKYHSSFYDTLIYFAFSGLGFACIENIMYVMKFTVKTALVRGLLSVPGHIIFSLLLGVFIALANREKIKNNNKSNEKTILYTTLIRPRQLVFEVLFMLANRMINNPGMSIIVLSLAMNFLVLPLYRRADAMQEEERDIENKLHAGVAHIKKTFKGDERMMILQTYYRQNDYKPTYVFKGSISLFLEIPFFIAAYQFLSHLEILKGVSFGVISDLGAADALIHIGGYNFNLLPFVMTGINLISCVIFTKGYPTKTKVQLYSMAIFFLFFLFLQGIQCR